MISYSSKILNKFDIFELRLIAVGRYKTKTTQTGQISPEGEAALKKAIAADTDEKPSLPQGAEMPPWLSSARTIRMGGFGQEVNYCKAMEEAEIDIGSCARGLLSDGQFRSVEPDGNIRIVTPSVGELGFTDACLPQLWESASRFNCGLLTGQFVCRFRLRYRAQPNGECLVAGMDPIDSRVFLVGRQSSGKMYLYAHSATARLGAGARILLAYLG